MDKQPLLVSLHGGPHYISPTIYSTNNAYLCSMGFAVLMVNYRGSLGMGDSFLKSAVGSKADYDDVMDAITTVLNDKKDEIDEERVGILGGSYGGYLTCALIGSYPDRFKAAVALNPVTSLPVLAGTSDIPGLVLLIVRLVFHRKWFEMEQQSTPDGEGAFEDVESFASGKRAQSKDAVADVTGESRRESAVLTKQKFYRHRESQRHGVQNIAI